MLEETRQLLKEAAAALEKRRAKAPNPPTTTAPLIHETLPNSLFRV